jgi:hypothetical protein
MPPTKALRPAHADQITKAKSCCRTTASRGRVAQWRNEQCPFLPRLIGGSWMDRHKSNIHQISRICGYGSDNIVPTLEGAL